ncbi:unnamed protein product [Closterium sp. NIES-53]
MTLLLLFLNLPLLLHPFPHLLPTGLALTTTLTAPPPVNTSLPPHPPPCPPLPLSPPLPPSLPPRIPRSCYLPSPPLWLRQLPRYEPTKSSPSPPTPYMALLLTRGEWRLSWGMNNRLDLEAWQVIAVLTDTVYGFAADARSAEGIARIYEIKGRDFNKPLAIAVADIADVAVYAETEHLPPGLLPALLPGPVTLVLPHRKCDWVCRNCVCAVAAAFNATCLRPSPGTFLLPCPAVPCPPWVLLFGG